MIISDVKKFVFVHIPKTGGTSIRTVLEKYATVGVWRHKVNGISPSKNRKLSKHAKAAVLRECLGPARWDSLFSFAFVRNPWDRIVSNYFYAKMHKKSVKHKFVAQRSFEEFVLWYGKNNASATPDMRLDTQSAYLVDATGNLLVDMIGRFENLFWDFSNICSKIGIKETVLHLNSSKHANYRNYYSKRTKEIVRDLFIDDVRRFNYSF